MLCRQVCTSHACAYYTGVNGQIYQLHDRWSFKLRCCYREYFGSGIFRKCFILFQLQYAVEGTFHHNIRLSSHIHAIHRA
jgi:hypothetical protein